MSSQPSDRVTLCGAGDPQTVNGASISASVDLSKFHEALFILQAGSIPSGGSVTAKLQEDSASNFGSASDIAGKAMTALADTDDNKQVLFNLKAEELSAGKRYARLLVTGSAHANVLSCVALGLSPRFGPASDDKASTVAQIVT